MITARALEVAIAARQAGQELALAVGGCPGLKLRVKPSGAASWSLRYRVPTGQKRVTIGRYPDMSLAAARTEGRKVLGRIAAGDDPSAERKQEHHAQKGTTFGDVAKDWTEGKLARLYPDHIRAKRSVKDDVQRLRDHILPHVGKVPITGFELEHAERVMKKLPPLARNTRRNVAVLMHRVLQMAVFPLRLRPHNPLPRGWLPRPGAKKAKSWLYPTEDAALIACAGIPLVRRLAYGVLAREGMRASELKALTWDALDLSLGVVVLDENKSDDPRAWALGGDVVEALKRWRDRTDPARHALVFEGVGQLRPDELRPHLIAAGVTRPQLFETSATRLAIRVHDFRGTFVTLSLATGKSEAWVTDRTGHKSSQMVALYKRAARLAGELGLGWLSPMHETIPELGAGKPGKVVRLDSRRR